MLYQWNLHRGDFLKFADTCGIQRRVAEKLIDKVTNKKDVLLEECRNSYLPDELKENLADLIKARTAMLKNQ